MIGHNRAHSTIVNRLGTSEVELEARTSCVVEIASIFFTKFCNLTWHNLLLQLPRSLKTSLQMPQNTEKLAHTLKKLDKLARFRR